MHRACVRTAAAVAAALLLLTAPGRAMAADPAPPEPTCTIVGTPGDDVLVGTPGDDVICGLGGDDVLLGEDGGDVLLGGPGDDTLVGGFGYDQLSGGSGSDLLADTREAGTQDGGDGPDRCIGVYGSIFTGCEVERVLGSRNS